MFPYDEWEAEQNRLPDPPELGPIELRRLLAKRYGAQAEMPYYETDLGALLDGFRARRERYGEDYKLVFRSGDYRPVGQALDLSWMDLSGTQWVGVNLSGTIARGVLWDDASITSWWNVDEGKKIKSDCSKMDFSGWQENGLIPHTAENLSCVEVNLSGSNWKGVLLKHSRFDRCDFRGASFRGAFLSWCNLWECDIEGADFRGAEFYACTLPLYGLHPALKEATIRANLSY